MSIRYNYKPSRNRILQIPSSITLGPLSRGADPFWTDSAGSSGGPAVFYGKIGWKLAACLFFFFFSSDPLDGRRTYRHPSVLERILLDGRQVPANTYPLWSAWKTDRLIRAGRSCERNLIQEQRKSKLNILNTKTKQRDHVNDPCIFPGPEILLVLCVRKQFFPGNWEFGPKSAKLCFYVGSISSDYVFGVTGHQSIDRSSSHQHGCSYQMSSSSRWDN